MCKNTFMTPNISCMLLGTVIRVGRVNMLEDMKTYQCDKCHAQVVVKVTDTVRGGAGHALL